MAEINESADPEGLKVFHYVTLDLKNLMFSLIGMHHMVRPFGANPDIRHMLT